MAANTTSGTNQSYESAGIRIFQGLKPDIVLIQEFNYRQGSLRDLVDRAFGSDYEYFVEPGNDSIPNGIISKYPIISAGQWNDSQISDRDFAWAVIDIPGDIDLQVVSVHLKSGSGSSGTRNNQAIEIRSAVQSHFDPNQYIVVGGDLNTSTRNEAAITTFDSFLDPKGHIPSDQEGNSNTSEPRTKPYDWVMPNRLLDNAHVTLHIGSSSYPNGIVFDSHVYSPLSEVYPVQYGDSHVNGMQHMAVMKAFEVGGSEDTPTPTQSPTPVHTHTPPPTGTQTQWTPTPPPTVTRTPTDCTETGVQIFMPYDYYYPGMLCSCQAIVCNAEGKTLTHHPLFVILQIADQYYFAPDFSDFANYDRDFSQGESIILVLPEFQWPAGAGSFEGAKWYGALTNAEMTEIFGTMGEFTFSWSE